jgi:hypothetical protein
MAAISIKNKTKSGSLLVGNSPYQVPGGFFYGGWDQDSNIGTLSIDKINFTDDSIASPSISLSSRVAVGASFANPSVAGYVGGGVTNGTNVQKFLFATTTSSTLSNTLSVNFAYRGGMNSATAGYIAGGCCNTAVIDKVTFATDTTSVSSATLSPSRNSPAGFANGNTSGYYARGNDGTCYTGINKIAFSTDTRSTISATTTTGCEGWATSNATTIAYIGGNSGTQVDKFTFSNETISNLGSSVLSAGADRSPAFSNGTTAAYIGAIGLTAPRSAINKIAYSNDTRTTLAATSGNRNGAGAFANNG